MTRSLFLLLISFLSWQSLQAQCDATFTFNQPAPNPCTTDPVDFFANADPATVDTYAWNFGPGLGNSNQANPTFTFPFNGPFNVTLTVTDTAGNVCSTTQTLNLPSAPPIFITMDTTFKCIQNSPDTLFSPTFTIDNVSFGQGPFDWDFGDGTFLNAHPNQVVNHTFDCYGTFTVTVTATGQNCPGYSFDVLFYTDPVSDLVLGGQPVFCEEDTIIAINQTDPFCNNVDYYEWDWGIFGEEYTVVGEDTQYYAFDLSNQDKCAAPLQGYVDAIQLTAVNACFTHFSTTQITIRPAPIAEFLPPDTVCLPDGLAIFFNETCPTDLYLSDPTDYFWDFGDGVGTSILRDPVYDYTNAGPGTYTVTLFASNDCGSDTISKDVVVVRAPIAAMIPDTNQGCAPFCMTFQNGTIPDTNEVPIHWQWNVYSDSAWSFGGGTDENSFEPIICFNAPDTFLVELIATNLCGADTVDTLIFVNIAPRILLDTLPDTCDVFVLDSLNYFLDDFGAPISDYNWTTTGVPANHNGPILPQVVFSPGNHTITLAVTNECGVTSESISFVVDPLPNVVAGPDQTICNNDTVFLDGTPKPGFWSGPGLQQDSVFVPDTLGVYELIYTFDAPRCFAYDTLYITVIDTPEVTAMADVALCEDSNTTITLTSNPPGGTWSGPNLINGNEFVADTAGTFVFTYTFVDSIGCPGRDQVVVIVNPEPVVDIMADTALFCLTNIPQPLPPASPPGGTWSGPGITDPINGLFNPDSLGGPDTVMLDYTFVSDSGCVNTDSLVVVVVVADSVTGGPGNTQCWNFGLDTLTGNSPSNGVWSGGPWVVDPNVGVVNTLLMNGGPNQLIYTFAPGTSCETSDTIFYNILDTLAVEAGPDEILCESSPIQLLTGFTPAGGTWSGLGILNATTGEFDPSLVPIGGSTQLTYEVVHPNGCVSRDQKTILVDSLPTVAFQVDSAACTGNPVFFDNQTIYGNSWEWDFGDGNGSVQFSPTHIYAFPDTGILTYQLIATSVNGCQDSLSGQILVLEAPTPDFTLAPDSGCAPLEVTITDLSDPARGTYIWDFGNGDSSFVPDPAPVTYQGGTDDTTYVITLTLTNGCGVVSHNDTVAVSPIPLVSFGPAVNSGCSPFPVDFGNATEGNPLNFFWYLDTISAATQFSTDSIPPTIFLEHLPDTGFTVYTIFLISTNDCGADTGSTQITVYPNTVDAFFNTNPVSGCEPLTVQFTGLSGAPNFGWLIDGSQPTVIDPVYTFNQAGTYEVFHYANNGCSFDTNSITVEVFPSPQVSFLPDTDVVCVGTPIQFTNTSPNTTGYNWDFGDNIGTSLENPTHTYFSPGTYVVTLTALSDTNSCPNTFTDTITVLPLPSPQFVVDDTAGCPPLVIQTDSTAPGLNYFWDFGDNSSSIQQHPSHVYSSPGVYFLTLQVTDAFGCENSNSATIRVFEVPTADFDVAEDTVCGISTPLVFTNLSSSPTTSIASFWEFGDGNTSTLTSPTHSYAAPGNYVVKLVVSNPFGCQDSLEIPVWILPQPIANLTVDSTQGCAPFSVTFQDLSTGNSTATWLIDGQTLTGSPLTYTYTVADTDVVTLVVDTADFCFDTATQVIQIANPPASDFSPSETEFCDAPATVTFTNLSQSEVPYTQTWDFGDGNGSTDLSPSHTYTAVGEYVVTMTLATDYGCEAVHQDTIFVYPQPVAAIGSDTTQGCVPLTVQFENLSTGYSDWSWIIDNGPVTTLNPSYTYTVADTDVVVLMVDTADFCFDTTTLTIQIANPPAADFSPSETEFCDAPATVTFTNLSQSEVPFTQVWDFGDGNGSTDLSPSHTYTAVGEYVVTMTLTTDYGCEAVHQDTIFVYPQPVAAIGSDTTQGCVPLTVQFENLSTGYSDWSWIIDNGPVTTLNPSYTYTVADTDVVVLMVDTADFCFDTTTLTIQIANPPSADFSPSETEFCDAPATVTFTNLSQSEVPYTQTWDFGDGNGSTDLSPSHTYTAVGEYVVTMTLTTDYGCEAVHQDTIFVYPQPVAAIGSDTTQGCVPLTVQFENLSTGYSDWSWIIDNGPVATLNPSYTYTVADTDVVVLMVDTADFCFDTTTLTIQVATPPTADFAMSENQFCSFPAVVQFTDQSQSEVPYTHFWDFGDGITSTNPNPGHTYNAVGHYEVLLVITADYGCVDSLTDSVFVYPVPQAALAADSLQGCVPFEVNFLDQSINASGYEWWVAGDTIFDPGFSYLFTSPPDTSFIVTLIADTADFCFDTTSIQIDIASPPLANFSVDWDQFCGVPALNSFTDLSQSTRPLQYRWEFGDGNSSVVPNPNHVYNATGEFVVSLEVINDYNCRDTLLDTVNVYPIPEAAILPEPQRGCAPLEVDFLNQSSNYTHSLWDFGDGSGASMEDSPSHLYTFADTSFIVKLVVDTANFCFDSTTVQVDVGSAPIANFEASLYEACGSARVQFTNLSFSAELPISFVWDLGNGITSALENPVTDYTSPGEYVVELVVRNSYECTDTLRQTITIYPQAVAMFDAQPLEGCQPLEVQFNNLSTDATEWRWEMGDGAIRREEAPLHTYEQIGTYSVELIASYEGECPDTLFLEDLITVLQTPMADFVAQDSLVNGRPDGSVRFINTTLFGERYEWDFGDGSPLSYVPSPSHRYFVNDTFTVRLVAWSADNCPDTTFQQITPLLFGDLHVPNALAPYGGPGEYSIFLPKGVGLIDYHIAVYSIWGDLVWESKELLDGQPAESWDGTIRGQVANSDVFVWKVHTAIFEGGRNWSGPREGSVTLIR